MEITETINFLVKDARRHLLTKREKNGQTLTVKVDLRL